MLTVWKNRSFAAAIALSFAYLVPTTLQAQCTINFANSLAAPVFDLDCTTRLSGAGFVAELWWGPAGTQEDSFLRGAATVFRSGIAAGTWITTNVSVPLTGGSPVAVQARVYESIWPSYQVALMSGARIGKSTVVNMVCGSPSAPGWPSFCLANPLRIVTQPTNQTVNVGATASFRVTAFGSAPITYQWRRSGTNLTEGGRISGVTFSQLTISSAQNADGGNYTAIVSNPSGSVTSAVAVLRVCAPPRFLSEPQNQTVVEGRTASFSVVAEGDAPLHYEWHFNGTTLSDGGRISGATSANLQISDVQSIDAGNYAALVSNSCGMITSRVASLTVLRLVRRSLPDDLEPKSAPPVERGRGVAQIKLDVTGTRQVGCTVQISAGNSTIAVYDQDAHDPAYYDLPRSSDLAWELVEWPDGPRPELTSSYTLATLRLPRVGNYRVRFTVCPSSVCQLNGVLVLGASQHVDIEAQAAVQLPVDKDPDFPASYYLNRRERVTISDQDCKCQGGGGVVDPQWVTVREFSGPDDYKLLEGRVYKSWVSDQDNFLNHDSHDFNFNVMPDPEYLRLVSTTPEWDCPCAPSWYADLIGVEWETDSFPERFWPSPGDRVSVFGYWILDCGHADPQGNFYTEIHPSVGIAVQRPRPVEIPEDEQLIFDFPDGPVSSSVGNNIIVPGVITDIWFNEEAGEITRNCSSTGLHEPALCNSTTAPRCIINSRIDRLFEFNIYLPKSPAATLKARGINVPPTPLYVKILNLGGPGGGGPDPEIIITNEVDALFSEGEVTYLKVKLPLQNFNGGVYARRIVAAWVYPSPDNWELKKWSIHFWRLGVIDPSDGSIGVNLGIYQNTHFLDGEWYLWFTSNNRDQEWTRILSHASVGGSLPVLTWHTGELGVSSRPYINPFDRVDNEQRLGPHILSYPEQGVRLGAGGYEDDAVWDDDLGRVSERVLSAGNYDFLSSNGKYRIYTFVREVPAEEEEIPILSAAAERLYSSYTFSECLSRSPHEISHSTHPMEAPRFLVPGISSRAPWRTANQYVSAAMGHSTAFIGDVDGDTYGDFAFGAPLGASGGEVQVYSGYPVRPSIIPLSTVQSDRTTAVLGQTVAGVGDVNGDGRPDFAIGASGFTGAHTNEGAAFLWYGGSLQTGQVHSPNTASWGATGNIPDAGFGYSIAGADFNRDGFSDVAVGAPFDNAVHGPNQPTGRVYVHFGSRNGLQLAPQILIPDRAPEQDPNNEYWFGHSLAVGDVNGDEFADLIVGAPRYSSSGTIDEGSSHQGAIFLFLGSALGLNPRAHQIIEGDAGHFFGFSAAVLHDVNGDGFRDVLVGAPDSEIGGVGAALLYRGSASGLMVTPSWTYVQAQPGSRFGAALAAAGDLDGDGLGDAVIGAPRYTRDYAEEGAVFIFLGTTNTTGLEPTPVWMTCGGMQQGWFGAAIAAGDVTSDTAPDLIVGQPGPGTGGQSAGRAFVHFGYRPTSIRPAAARFFRAVGREEFSLHRMRDAEFAVNLQRSGDDSPEKLGRMLMELRQELNEQFLGTSLEVEALNGLIYLKNVIPTDIWNKFMGDLDFGDGGKAVYINCGVTNRIVDNLGREWRRDSPFLRSTNAYVEEWVAGTAIDRSLLTDQNVPRDLLLSETFAFGDLNYEIPVPNGLYTVVLYFSENCVPCVSTNLGGTGCNTCARIFDLEVENMRLNNYSPADAAISANNDGVGRTFKATEVFFRNVAVTNQVLNVNLLSRNSPTNYTGIKGMMVLEQTGVDSFGRPQIASIRRNVTQDVEIVVGPRLSSAAVLANAINLTLEQSSDLKNWSPTGIVPASTNQNLIFRHAPAARQLFYRIAATSTLD
jgi:hypothetical protein